MQASGSFVSPSGFAVPVAGQFLCTQKATGSRSPQRTRESCAALSAALLPGRNDSSHAALSGVLALLLGCAAVVSWGASARKRGDLQRSRTVMQVRKRPLPVLREKEVTATKRIPLWMLSDEMYLQRQLAPDPEASWTEVRRAQARMREQVLEQQKRDLRAMERELAGTRLSPSIPIGELRVGQWLEGRVSRKSTKGVLVDIGVYTERGEWVDGYLHVGQMREDGAYVREDRIMSQVYLGEHIRVRVAECIPAAGLLRLSMRDQEDLPELFMGKPRPYSVYDLDNGMKVTGIVRRVWDRWALVDIGANRLARVHVNEHKRGTTRYGFLKLGQLYKYAEECYARGAELELWVKEIRNNEAVMLSCNKTKMNDKAIEAMKKRGPGWDGPEQKVERLTREQRRDREKSEAEKAPWLPYVPHVDEWLEAAAEPDDETDSWVARTEKELFAEVTDKLRGEGQWDDDDENDEGGLNFNIEPGQILPTALKSEIMEDIGAFGGDDFGADEFADDDFADESNSFGAADAYFGYGSGGPTGELDGWVLNGDASQDELGQADKFQEKLGAARRGSVTEAEVEDLFHSPDDRGAEDFDPADEEDFSSYDLDKESRFYTEKADKKSPKKPDRR